MTKKEWQHEKDIHAEFDRLYPSMKDNWKETMKAQQEDRESHRAAVEAGYASLAEYIEKWGNETEGEKEMDRHLWWAQFWAFMAFIFSFFSIVGQILTSMGRM